MKKGELLIPKKGERVLLHVCCAPCSGSIVERLCDASIPFFMFFYNPNIHPFEEYEKRKAFVVGLAKKRGVGFFDGDYDSLNWFSLVKGLEGEPEKGARCTVCFEMRLRKAAQYALSNGFDVLATTLGISRWKDQEEVYRVGRKVGSEAGSLVFWDYNWRKNGGLERAYEIVREESFYQQSYCGCEFSKR